MRRTFAVVSAAALIVVLAGSVLATGPHSQVNRFVGNFDLLDPDGRVVGHVVANFTEPSDKDLVPGTLDVTWAPYDSADPPFPFLDLDWPPVRESHAQLIGTSFGPEPGYALIAGAGGYLCDYTAPWNGGCREFAVHFDIPFDGSGYVSWWSVDGADEVMFGKGQGSFVITYSGPTDS